MSFAQRALRHLVWMAVWASPVLVSAEPGEGGIELSSTGGAALPDDGSVIRRENISFRSAGGPGDTVLRGVSAHGEVRFPLPRTWIPGPGNVVLLRFAHSTALDKDRSGLTVRFNGAIVATLALGKQPQPQIAEVPLPGDQFRPTNRLEFSAVQHLHGECERPFDEALWTAISDRSEIRLHYRTAPRVPDLSEFPFPLVDDRSLQRQKVSIMRPADPDDSTLTAIARVMAGLGRVTRGREIEMLAAPGPEGYAGALLAIGTARELRALGRPGLNLPVPVKLVSGAPSFVDSRGNSIQPGVGILEVTNNPAAQGRPLLVVGGNDVAGLLKAVTALVERHHAGALSGSAILVTSAKREEVVRAQPQPGLIPRGKKLVTFEELGIPEMTIRPTSTREVAANFGFAPDEHPTPKKHQVRIVYSYGAGMDGRDSTLEVVLNDISIGGARLGAVSGEVRQELALSVPGRFLQPRNRLLLRFHLFPQDRKRCEGVAQDHLWATVHRDSSIEIQRDRWTELPDMGLLQYGLFPYTDPPDLSGVALVTRARVGLEGFRTFVNLALALGRETRSRRIEIAGSTSLQSPTVAGRHVIAVEDPGSAAVAPELAALRRLRALGPSGPLRRESSDVLLATLNEAGFGVVEQLLLPGRGGETVLFLSGAHDTELSAALRALLDPKRRRMIQGAAMAIPVDEQLPTRIFEPDSRRVIGERPLADSVSAWLIPYYWPAVGLFFVLLGIAFVFYRRLRTHRLRRRLAESRQAVVAPTEREA
jgi:hypothetical protein